MKLKNCVRGQRVIIKDTSEVGQYLEIVGMEGKIVEVLTCEYDLTVLVKLLNGATWWLPHKDLRKVREGDI